MYNEDSNTHLKNMNLLLDQYRRFTSCRRPLI